MNPAAPPVYVPPLPTVERPDEATDIIYLHGDPVPADAKVLVDATDLCCGLASGRVAFELEAGTHAAPSACDFVLFISRQPFERRVGRALGELPDARGAAGEVAIYGAARFCFVDPRALAHELAAYSPFDLEALLHHLDGLVLEAASAVVRDGLTAGHWDLSNLEHPDVTAAICERAPEALAAQRGALAGVALELTELSARCTVLTREPPAPPAAPAPATGDGYPPGCAVLVQWSDGNRYPGHVQQSAEGHCLIGFPDGQQHWIPLECLSPG